MGRAPSASQSEAAPDVSCLDIGVMNASVSVRAPAAVTETQARARAQRCLPDGWRVGAVTLQTADGDEVIFAFDVVTNCPCPTGRAC